MFCFIVLVIVYFIIFCFYFNILYSVLFCQEDDMNHHLKKRRPQTYNPSISPPRISLGHPAPAPVLILLIIDHDRFLQDKCRDLIFIIFP